MQEVLKLLQFLSIESQITEIKSIGPYKEEKKRTIFFRVSNKFHRRLILLSISRFKVNKKLLFVSKELNAEEAELERSLLKLRRDLIQSGTQRNELRIRNLK